MKRSDLKVGDRLEILTMATHAARGHGFQSWRPAVVISADPVKGVIVQAHGGRTMKLSSGPGFWRCNQLHPAKEL